MFYREFGWTPSEVKAIPLAEALAILTVLVERSKYDNRPQPKPVSAA